MYKTNILLNDALIMLISPPEKCMLCTFIKRLTLRNECIIILNAILQWCPQLMPSSANIYLEYVPSVFTA